MSLIDLVARVQHIEQQLGIRQLDLQPVGTASVRAIPGSAALFAQELSAAQAASASSVTGEDVVAAALRYLGVPYVFGGTDPATGLDCSGLVQRVYRDLGIELPRIAADQARMGTPVPSLAHARPGDLLAFNDPVDHIAIYIGDGKMIAAPQPGERVKIQDVYQQPSAIRRIIPDASPTPVGGTALWPQAVRSTLWTQAAGSAAALAQIPYGDLFVQAGTRYGVSPALLAAVAKVESGYNPRAVSPAGAQGLMQLMPATARELGVTNPFDPAMAIDGAARLLANLLREFGSLPLALAAYNAGSGAVRQYGGIPPYPETQSYVRKVQEALASLT
ncbi:MAG TPA: transglycosylase SLT domain-containing protein [Micromonospora sp.]